MNKQFLKSMLYGTIFAVSYENGYGENKNE